MQWSRHLPLGLVMQPIPLAIVDRGEIIPSAPFNFDATLHKPDHFPTA